MRNGKNYIPGMYTCDTAEVKDMCLNCKRADCPGDCGARRMAAGLRAPKGNHAIHRAELNMERLSPREREFVALYDRGLCDRECAEHMGLVESSAWSIRTKLGLPAIGHKKRRKEIAYA